MFSTLIFRWRNWRLRRTIKHYEHTLKAMRKLHQDENEVVRLLAALSILKLDPTKSDELMPHIHAARGSENLVVRDLADEFLADKKHHIAA
jgi:hypothetical protein